MKKAIVLLIACMLSGLLFANHYEPVGGYSQAMTVVSSVLIDGEFPEYDDDVLEVAAFCGDECRATFMAYEYTRVLQNGTVVAHFFRADLTVSCETGETISFKMYNPVNDTEYETSTTVTGDENGYGTMMAPLVLDFISPAAQSYPLDITGYGSNPGGYYLIASPVTVDPAEVEGDPQGMTEGNFDLYYFDNSKEDEWINWEGGDGHFNIVPGKGYLYAREEDAELELSGELYDGNGQFDLAYSTGNPSADMRGWNLVGNPFLVGASVDKDAFYVMNEEGRNDIIVSEETAIAPMQGIFVLATAEGQTVKFTRAYQPLDGKVVLNLNRNRGTVIDRAIVRLGEGGTLPKFMLNPENTKIYIEQGGDDYAMVSSNEDEIPVSFKAASNGTYTLNVAVQNAELDYLHLIDNLAGTDTDLLANPNYTFEANTGDYASRFTLVLRNTTGLVEHFAFFNGHNWTVSNQGEATLQVIDVTGRLVSTKTIDGTTQLDINAAPGVYMFRLVNGSDVKVQKVIVR